MTTTTAILWKCVSPGYYLGGTNGVRYALRRIDGERASPWRVVRDGVSIGCRETLAAAKAWAAEDAAKGK